MNQWYDAHIILIQSTLTTVLLALSLQIPLRMGVFSFAGVGFYGIGAYASVILSIRFGLPIIACVGGAAAFAGLSGYLLGLTIQRMTGLYLSMATIALDLILSVIAINGGSLTGGAQGLVGIIVSVPIALVIITVVLVLIVAAASERGRSGRCIATIREDTQLAQAMGMNVPRLRRLSFVVSGILGGLSGGLSSLLHSGVSPADVGFPLIVLALTVIVVGGSRSWLGAVIGAIIFTWLPEVLTVVGKWYPLAYGVIVVLVAVWVPGGIVGVASNAVHALQRRRDRDELQVGSSPPEDDGGASRRSDGEIRRPSNRIVS